MAADTHTASLVEASAACMPETRPPLPRLTSSSPSSTATMVSGPRLEATSNGARPVEPIPRVLPPAAGAYHSSGLAAQHVQCVFQVVWQLGAQVQLLTGSGMREGKLPCVQPLPGQT